MGVMSLRYLISLVVLIGIVLALPTSINKKPCPNNSRECIYRELLQRGLIKAAALPLSPSNGGHHVRLSPTLSNEEGRQFRTRGRRPNTKFRPDCWTQDSQGPPPIADYSATSEEASETAQETRNPRRKQEQQNPCTWEMDYPTDPSMAYDDY